MTQDQLDALRILVAHGSACPPEAVKALIAAYEREKERGHELGNEVMRVRDAALTLEEQIARLMAPVNAPGGDR